MRKIFTKDRISGMLSPVLIILASFFVITLILVLIGVNPFATYGSMLHGAFGSSMGIINTLTKAVPICLAALGVAVSRQTGIFNIGINGQIAVGAVGTVVVAIYLKGLPSFIHIPLALLAGMICGMIYAILPTIMYLKKRVNLIVIGLLMNTMATKIVTWLVFSFLLDPECTNTATHMIQPSAQLPNLISSPAKLNIGVIIALAAALLVYIYFYKTTAGYELKACGMNRQAATYAGVKANRYLGSSLIISGALAGLAGGIEILGTYYRLYDGFSPAYGFDGIPIAMLANGNPLGIILGSILFGGLRVGSTSMQIKMGVSSELVTVVQGVLICFIALEYIFRFSSSKLLKFSFSGKHRKAGAD